jgi:hypothetical protein
MTSLSAAGYSIDPRSLNSISESNTTFDKLYVNEIWPNTSSSVKIVNAELNGTISGSVLNIAFGLLQLDATGSIPAGLLPTGLLYGPGLSTDNALVRWDGVLGALVKNSVGVLSNTGNLTGLVDITSTGTTGAATINATAQYNFGGSRLIDVIGTSHLIGIGTGTPSGVGNTVVGSSAGAALTTGTNNTVLGLSSGSSINSNNNCVVIGNSADVATGISGAVAIGFNADVSAADSIAIGTGAICTVEDAIAIGRNSISSGGVRYSIAIGNDASVTTADNGGIAIGHQASVSGVGRGISIGSAAITQSFGAICIGNDSDTDNDGQISIGRLVSTTNIAGAITIGQSSTNSSGAVSIGPNNDISVGLNVTAIGASIITTGDNVTLVGRGSGGFDNCTVVGQNAGNQAMTGNSHVIIGRLSGNTTDSGTHNVIIGNSADTGAAHSDCIVIGANATSVASGELVLGSGAHPLGTSGTATAGAAVLPVTPVGFIDIRHNGVDIRIPYYAP